MRLVAVATGVPLGPVDSPVAIEDDCGDDGSEPGHDTSRCADRDENRHREGRQDEQHAGVGRHVHRNYGGFGGRRPEGLVWTRRSAEKRRRGRPDRVGTCRPGRTTDVLAGSYRLDVPVNH